MSAKQGSGILNRECGTSVEASQSDEHSRHDHGASLCRGREDVMVQVGSRQSGSAIQDQGQDQDDQGGRRSCVDHSQQTAARALQECQAYYVTPFKLHLQ